MENLVEKNTPLIFAHSFKGAISSAGSEHLPYKQGVTSSNLVSPTFSLFFNFVALSGGVFLFFKQKSFFNKKNRIFALLFAESLFN